ncbi:Protein disulfide-isomerase-like protein EhSep2 [Durusdinium trenchii]|uniref:Protein disulfide-isomerase-like protein EhSep2 n=1 Tax=Durusdinium trenchii TaxID=1381693 RepID=A0ABP0JTT2_9DINO
MIRGKAVFLKFFTPWCGQRKTMKPAWDALMEEYRDDESVLVAEVDCEGNGKAKCKEMDVKSYPAVKYGDPFSLEDYTGGRDLPSLQKFAQDLTPACGPERLDWCDNKRKKQVQGYMDLPPEELDAKVKEQEDSLAAVQKEVDDLLQSMQKEYAEARQRKEEKVDEIRRGGLGLLKMVQAGARLTDFAKAEEAALKMVRKRRAQRDPGERSRAEIPQRLETPGDGNVPKYLRLSCILRPVAAQVPMPPHSQRRKRRPRQQPRATPMSWSELRDALGLTVAAGLGPLLLKCASGEHRLPTGVWIVLDPMVAERLRRDTVTEEELAEAADLPLGSRPCAGKAWVAQQSVSSLQLLDEDELTWSAAEANFAKCARGSCFVALKHAAFVLKALATKKCMQAQEEGVEPEKPLETTLEEIDSKVNRAAGLVGSRAAAESRRKKSPERQKKAQEPAPESVSTDRFRCCLNALLAWLAACSCLLDELPFDLQDHFRLFVEILDTLRTEVVLTLGVPTPLSAINAPVHGDGRFPDKLTPRLGPPGAESSGRLGRGPPTPRGGCNGAARLLGPAVLANAGAGSVVGDYLRSRGITAVGAFAKVASTEDALRTTLVQPLLAGYKKGELRLTVDEADKPIVAAVMVTAWEEAKQIWAQYLRTSAAPAAGSEDRSAASYRSMLAILDALNSIRWAWILLDFGPELVIHEFWWGTPRADLDGVPAPEA